MGEYRGALKSRGSYCAACRTIPPRKPIGVRLRFVVFRPDDFTCRYYGRSAPSVILHVDHIIPVSRSGTDEISNLVTACADCNLGKYSRPI
jgi:5-methylcytosine-specific restriction endonuclease McrA